MSIIPFLKQWKLLVSISAPILLGTIPYFWKGGHTGKEPYAAYVILLMAVFWVFECVPLAITSLFPIFLFPLLGITSSDKVSTVYLQDSVLFLMGGVIIALAVENCNLHTRIAIKVMLLIGARIPHLLLGMMLTTMTLSMWMNNTSTTAMMVPIVNAILEQIQLEMLSQHKSHETNTTENIKSGEIELETLGEHSQVHRRKESLDSVHKKKTKKSRSKMEIEDVHKKIRNLKVMFLLAVAYASNIGGTGIITGSATNVIAVALIRKDAEQDYCPEKCKEYLKIGFVQWVIFNVPTMILNTLACWAYLMIHFMGISLPASWKFWNKKNRNNEDKATDVIKGKVSNTLEQNITEAIQAKYTELGSISFDEICVCIIFALTVFLWIIPLNKIFNYGPSFIREATPTFLSCIILFIIPRKKEYFRNIMKGGLRDGLKDSLLTWDFVHKKFPWGVFILLGGGSAMAHGSKESGLNKWIEEILESNETLKALPTSVLLIIILTLITLLTTIASNTATAAIITPVILGLCYVKGIHPLYIVLPAATACSYAFMLPISTSPNAIVYGSTTTIKIWDMITCGFVLNVLTMTILFITTNTLNNWIFQFDNYNNECKNMTGIPIH